MEEDVRSCLAGVGTCDASPCERAAVSARSCLAAHIPAWGASTLARIHCCLRCCLEVETARLGLAANERHWRARGVDFWVSTGAGTRLTADSDEPAAREPAAAAVLNARFAVARFAHVQAVTLADWTALVEHLRMASRLRSPLPPQFAAPGADAANGTLIVLNGWGWSSRNLTLPGEVGGSAAGRIGHKGRFVHRIAHAGRRYDFEDPLLAIFRRLRGRHAVHYGNDHSLSARVVGGYYKTALGHSLARYLAPNLDAEAAALPCATAVPLGLNSNGHALASLLLEPRVAALHVGRSHRRPELLCCCMKAWKHRVRVLRVLREQGHACSNATLPWTDTIEQYLAHRFVLAVWGNGRNDFRYWEVLSAGAVPVMQRFAEHDALFEGLPVVRVDDWASLTPAFLQAEWERIADGVGRGTLSWTKVYLPYWLHEHTRHLRPPRSTAMST